LKPQPTLQAVVFSMYVNTIIRRLALIHRSTILNEFHGDWGLIAFSG